MDSALERGVSRTEPDSGSNSEIYRPKVDPKVLKDPLEEHEDFFPALIPGLPLVRGVQLSFPLIEGADPVGRANVPI